MMSLPYCVVSHSLRASHVLESFNILTFIPASLKALAATFASGPPTYFTNVLMPLARLGWTPLMGLWVTLSPLDVPKGTVE